MASAPVDAADPLPDTPDPISDAGPGAPDPGPSPEDTGIEDVPGPEDVGADAVGDNQDAMDAAGPVDTGGSDAAEPDTFVEPDPCDDDNPCTEDTQDDTGLCVNTYVYGICCNANPHCNDDDPCTTDLCVDGLCAHESSCCEDDSQCADGETACTVDTCVDGACLHVATGDPACCTPQAAVAEADFDDNTTQSMVITNSDPNVGWHVLADNDTQTAPHALWYRSQSGAGYDSGERNSGTARLEGVALPGGGVEITLGFELFLGVEAGTLYDTVVVRLTEQETGRTHVLWHKGNALAYQQWVPIVLRLDAFGGQVVTLEWAFDTIDGLDNVGVGVGLDSIRLASETCAATECVFVTECDDGLGVTEQSCVGGTCAFSIDSNFCTTQFDCDDGKLCTDSVCNNEQCSYPINFGCCLTNEDCEDGNACTLNDCIGVSQSSGGFCLGAVSIPGCCTGSDAQCNDNDPCTIDSCQMAGGTGVCANTSIAGCCTTLDDCDDGNPCTEDVCIQGTCDTLPLCCANDLACDDGDDACTVNACVDGVCQTTLEVQAGCCTLPHLSSTFPGATTSGWTVVDDSNAADGVGWAPVNQPAASAPGAMRFGGPQGSYATGARVFGSVRSEVIVLPATAQAWVDFEVLLDNEYSNGATNAIEWDRLTLVAERTDGGGTLVLWDSAEGSPVWWQSNLAGEPFAPQWTSVRGLSLTAMKGRKVRLVFTFDSIDADANAFAGAFVDDVKVITTCQP